MTTYLLDASALYPLVLRLREKILLYSERFRVLDLTTYEVGNVIWKEHRRGKIKDLAPVVAMFENILRNIDKLSIGSEISEVIGVAVKNNVTFYDASYIYIAQKYGLKLVTEDIDLKRFPEAISVDKLIDFNTRF